MSSQNRIILAQETLKGGNVFANYASKVTRDPNGSVIKDDKIPCKTKGKKY